MKNEKILKIIAGISGFLGMLTLGFYLGILFCVKNMAEVVVNNHFMLIYRITMFCSILFIVLFITSITGIKFYGKS